MAGYPDQYKVSSRNRHHSNQPGGLAKPEQVQSSDFSPSDPKSTHMRLQADALRTEEPLENSMNYAESNQPETGEDYSYAPD